MKPLSRRAPALPRLRVLMLLFMIFSLLSPLWQNAGATANLQSFQDPNGQLCHDLDADDNLVLSEAEAGALAGDPYNYTDKQIAEVASYCEGLPSMSADEIAADNAAPVENGNAGSSGRNSIQPLAALGNLINSNFQGYDPVDEVWVESLAANHLTCGSWVTFRVIGTSGAGENTYTFTNEFAKQSGGNGLAGYTDAEFVSVTGATLVSQATTETADTYEVTVTVATSGEGEVIVTYQAFLECSGNPNSNLHAGMITGGTDTVPIMFGGQPNQTGISPSITADPFVCEAGATSGANTFSVDPGAGFENLAVYVDGVLATETATPGIYELPAADGTYEITVTFTLMDGYDAPAGLEPVEGVYTITQSVDVDSCEESIVPSITVDPFVCEAGVTSGANTFTVDPGTGFENLTVFVDGVLATETATPGTYELPAANGTYEILVTFTLMDGYLAPADLESVEGVYTITQTVEVAACIPIEPGTVIIVKYYCEGTELEGPVVMTGAFDSDDCVRGADSSIFDILDSGGMSVLGEGDDIFVGIELMPGSYTLVEYAGDVVILEYPFEVVENQTFSIVVVNPVEEAPGVGVVVKYFCADADITAPVVGDEGDYDDCEPATAEQLEGVNFWVYPFGVEADAIDVDDTALLTTGVELPVGTHTLVEEVDGVVHELGDLVITEGGTTTITVFNPAEVEEITLNLYKFVCSGFSEKQEDGCVESDELDGTSIDFTVTYTIGEEETTVETSVVIEGSEGTAVLTLPLADSYTICETMPEGVEGLLFAVGGIEDVATDENGCITFSGESLSAGDILNVIFWNDMMDKTPTKPEKPVTPVKPVPVTSLPNTGSGDIASTSSLLWAATVAMVAFGVSALGIRRKNL